MLLDTQKPKCFFFFTKVKDFLKLTVVMWSHIVEKVAVFGLAFFEKNIAKKYQKQQFVSILWKILRPKPAMLPDF